jgi:hypothetical protein
MSDPEGDLNEEHHHQALCITSCKMMENKKAYDKANLEGAINSFLTDRR